MPVKQILPREENPLMGVIESLGGASRDIYNRYQQGQDTQRAMAAQRPGMTEMEKFNAIVQSTPYGGSQQQQQTYQTMSALDQQQRAKEDYQRKSTREKKDAERDDKFRERVIQRAREGEELSTSDIAEFIEKPKELIPLMKENKKERIKQEQNQKIADMMSTPEWEDASEVEQRRMMSKVAPERVPLLIRDQQENRVSEQKKTDLKKYHSEQSQKWYEEVNAEAKQARVGRRSTDEMRRLIDTGNATTESKLNMLASIFPEWTPSSVRNKLMTPEAQALKAAGLQQIIGLTKAFGYNFTDRDLALVADKIASFDKDPKSNMSILALTDLNDKIKIKREQVMNEIIAANEGFRPFDIISQTERILENDPELQNSYGTAYRALVQTDKKGKHIPGWWFKKDLPANPEKGIPERKNTQHFISAEEAKKNPLRLKSYQASWEEIK